MYSIFYHVDKQKDLEVSRSDRFLVNLRYLTNAFTNTVNEFVSNI